MKAIAYSLFLLVLMLIASATITFAQRNDPCYGDPNETDVLTLVARFDAAINANDPKTFAACFTYDADVTNWFGKMVHNQLLIQDVMGFVVTQTKSIPKPILRNPSIRFLKPDVAVVDIQAENKSDSLPKGTLDSPNRYLLNWVVTKDASGQWLIRVFHTTRLFDAQPATAHN